MTWATFPDPTKAPTGYYYFSDIGVHGSLWYNNGTEIHPVHEIVLFQNAVPFLIPSSGSIGDNGALTGITALLQAYPNCYMYFPANAISAGSAAGWYYVVMSSTTAGTIYNNVYTTGLPTIPSSPIAFVTTGPGAYTQTTGSFINVYSFNVPGNLLGINGFIDVFTDKSCNNSAGNKIDRALFSANEIHQVTNTTYAGQSTRHIIQNRGRLDRQRLSHPNTTSEAVVSSGTSMFKSINTAVDSVYQFQLQIAVATDTVGLERVFAKVSR